MTSLNELRLRLAKPSVVKLPKAKASVQCLECGKKFSTSKICPECPRCHGLDIDLAY